jgi:iron complex outermembrane receptor protein
MELGLDQQFGESWRLKAAWTWLDATYRTNVCDDASCNGNRIPGIARNMGYASLAISRSRAGTPAAIFAI